MIAANSAMPAAALGTLRFDRSASGDSPYLKPIARQLGDEGAADGDSCENSLPSGLSRPDRDRFCVAIGVAEGAVLHRASAGLDDERAVGQARAEHRGVGFPRNRTRPMAGER